MGSHRRLVGPTAAVRAIHPQLKASRHLMSSDPGPCEGGPDAIKLPPCSQAPTDLPPAGGIVTDLDPSRRLPVRTQMGRAPGDDICLPSGRLDVVAAGKGSGRFFPELVAAAAEQLPSGAVLDSEAVIWSQGRLDLPGRRPRPTPRIVTTASFTSHVHTLSGPPDSTGPVFVLLHGIGMSHRYYRRLQALLAQHGDTHAIDLPGFGGTPRPDRQLSIAEYAGHIAATLEKMGSSRIVLIGHSMGTQFATELAVQRPDLVSHLVLLGPVVDPARRTVFQQALSLGLDSLLESPVGNGHRLPRVRPFRPALVPH